ncbi:hypothetical protein TNCT_341331 [Trichonephila clavata]|uniref:Uncharacterized protein n=1 Tax=Trichonephila clavata TaxID=2740835 RepID=A0A8X6KU44_TRICU|nr:hypothetical protein TNCT_341331 [Trichonephila clavata]
MDISVAIAQLDETTEKCSEITDNKSTYNYENVKFETTIEGQIKSNILILDSQIYTDSFSSRMEETSSSKTFSPFTLRSNIFEPSEQSSESSSVTPLVQSSKYVFYDDNGKKFIIDNADFEEEDRELIDIFNLNPKFSHNNPNFDFLENRSYNETCHFYPISPNASKKEDEGAKEKFYYHTEEEVKENTIDNNTDKDVKENTANSFQNKNIFRKMKSFLKKVRKNKRIHVSYQRFSTFNPSIYRFFKNILKK